MSAMTNQDFTTACKTLPIAQGRGWQGRLSAALNSSQSQVSRILSGKIPVSDKMMNRLAAAQKNLAGVSIPQVAVHQPAAQQARQAVVLPEPEPERTDEEIIEAQRKQFEAMENLVVGVISGNLPAVAISGPPGIGKSYPVEQWLEIHDKPYERVAGSIKPTGLFQRLWNTRDGGVLVLDDCDSVFREEEGLNLLKAALDTTDKRMVSWAKQSSWLKREEIESTFEYRGHVIFLTNLDLVREASRENRMGEHMKAVKNRCFYVDLGMRTKREMVVRIKDMVLNEGMLRRKKVTDEQAKEIVEYLEDRKDKIPDLSLRTAVQAALLLKADPYAWRDMADVAICGKRR